MSSDLGQVLKDACAAVVENPAFKPRFDKKTGAVLETHCNEAAAYIAVMMGCHELTGLFADDQYATMLENKVNTWKKGTGSDATVHALSGGLAFAAATSKQLGETHGHIATIVPLGMQLSSSWKKDVPIVANVGKINGTMRVSQAFPVAKGEPDYFLWSPGNAEMA